MVRLLIGSKGKLINHIMEQSNTNIVINQPINKMIQRTVSVEGKSDNIAIACQIIYDKLESLSMIAHEIEKVPQPIDVSKLEVKAKLLIKTDLLDYL